jgi:GNAT superfamily N-acetyltransferase
MASAAGQPQAVRRSVAENLRLALSQYAMASPKGTLEERPRLTLVNSGLRYSVFNSAILSEPGVSTPAELTSILVASSGYFHKRGLPWTFWMPVPCVGERLLPRARGICARFGLRLVAEHDGMHADQILPPLRPLPELDIVPVNGAGSRHTFAEVSRQVFGLPKWVAGGVYESGPLWEGAMAGWVGSVGGTPVCISSTVTAAGAVGVYSVATLPAYRRLGYGEAITRAALVHAQRRSGLSSCVLHATPLGLPIYLKMGFRPITQIYVFSAGR